MTRTLLVIDVQNECFTGGLLPLWEADETEARIVAAIHRARAEGDAIVLVQHVSPAETGLFAKGSVGAKIRPAILEAAGSVPLVTKRFADAFQENDLASHLTQTDTLVITGMMTQNCVVFTALSRAAGNVRIEVVGELCTASTEVVHKIALNSTRIEGARRLDVSLTDRCQMPSRF